MTRKQMAFILGINAVISTAITLLIVLVILPAVGRPVAVATPTLATEVAQRITDSASGPTPAPTPVIHIVQAGETISALALKYDVPAEDIIAANGLENPNSISIGMELLIPIGGVPQTTPTFTPAPTPTETEIPFEPPSADMTATAAAEAGATATDLPTSVPTSGELQIEIAEVVAPGQADREAVIINNVGERLADMTGWTLSDAEGNVYTFPNFRLWGNGSSVTIHTRIGQDGNPTGNFYWGKLEALWSVGETVTLKDAQGGVVVTYTVQP